MSRIVYPSDLTDEQWAILAPLIPPAKANCRPRKADMREVTNGIFYLLRTGCAWRYLPHDLPPYRAVYYYFSKWRKCGVWKKIHDALHERLRQEEGRQSTPSAAIIDSQSVKTTEAGGLRGFDSGKKVKGRKRQVLVDTLGLVLYVMVQSAQVQDRDGARLLFERILSRFPRLQLIWADSGYAGPKLGDWLKAACRWLLEIVRRADPAHTFVVQPHRWIVERTFGWFNRERRLSKDYERLPETSEAWIYVTMTRLMVRRLVREPVTP